MMFAMRTTGGCAELAALSWCQLFRGDSGDWGGNLAGMLSWRQLGWDWVGGN